MTGLDLSGITRIVEDLILLDVVRFTTPGGQPVFNEDTGKYETPEGSVLYEGPGAVQPGSASAVANLPIPTQPWVNETTANYRAFTPLAAPIAPRGTIVTVVQVHEGGDVTLIGRQWRTNDPSLGGTLGVVRVTSLDQIQQTASGGA